MTFINTQEELDIILDSISSAEVIAIDTEFCRINTYFPILSIIQISCLGVEFAIDARENLDFSVLKKILEDKKIIKVFHAPKQDICALEYNLGIKLNNIFDTQIAAIFLGLHINPSLADLCRILLDIKIHKHHQFSNWLKRPLDQKQIDYAINDVKYLEQIYSLLREKLEENGRLSWVFEENEEPDPGSMSDFLWMRFTHNPKNIEEYIFLRSITLWRDRLGRELDISPNIVLKNSTISLMLKNELYYEAEFANDSIVKETAIFEFEQIQNVLNSKDLSEIIKNILNFAANRNNIPPHIVATKDELFQFLIDYQKPSRILRGWRKKIFGDIAARILEEYGIT